MKRLVAGVIMSAIIFTAAVTSASAESYEVKKGDNLWDIANEYNTTMEYLIEINQLDSTIIQPRQMIIVNETYTVEKGDTLIGIGRALEVTVDEIMEWNELTSSLILIGQELNIYNASIVQKDEGQSNTSAIKAAAIASSAPEVNKSMEQVTKSSEKPDGKTIAVKATAYTAKCDGCSGVTYTGVDLNKNRNAKVIAVDPKVIPLGTEVYVEGYGYAIAADIGSAIKGNRIDIHLPTKKEAYSWGVRNVNVTIIGKK